MPPSCPDDPATERTQACLLATHQLLQTVLDQSPDLIVLKDEAGRFLLCNQAVARFYGTTPDAMVGKEDGDFSASPEQAAFFRDNVRAIMASGQTQTVLETSTDAQSGQVRHFQSIKKPFKDPAGSDRILVIAHDITGLIEAEQRLATSEQRMRHVLDILGAAVWDWDVAADRLIPNRRWCELLGCDRTGLIGTLADYRRCFHPEDAAAIEAGLAHALGSGLAHEHEHRLVDRQGQTIWVSAHTKVVETGSQGEPLRVVGSLTDITARKQAEQAAHRLVFFDPLTGLGNRRQLKDHLQHRLGSGQAQGQLGALLFIDVDHFKELNDTQGHSVGDQCLVQLAAHMLRAVGQQATVARIGGDEFAVLPDNLYPSAEEAVLAASGLAYTLLGVGQTDLRINSQLYQATLSIGVALYGEAQDTCDTVMRNADLAMYEAKRSGRNGVRFFDARIQQALQRRTQLQAELQLALQTGQLRLAYQPLVDQAQACVGMEALVRWEHPVRGLVMPGSFIDVAEETGQIEGIGLFVLERVCHDLAQWQHDPQRQHWTVGVNVSVRQFNRPRFAEEVMALLHRSGAPAHRLKLEITESLLLRGTGQVLHTIHRLRDTGVLFSVDDFGTGYSSLAYLQNLPIDELKIDQSFVRPLDNKPGSVAIVNTILTLARELGLGVVAEGVETVTQFDTLHALGCPCFQGYLFGRPALATQHITA